jgi:hypothetical protein
MPQSVASTFIATTGSCRRAAVGRKTWLEHPAVGDPWGLSVPFYTFSATAHPHYWVSEWRTIVWVTADRMM